MEKKELSPENLNGGIETGEGNAAVPTDAKLRVTVTADGMEAFLELRAPENGGKRMTAEAAGEAIAAAGVTYGIDRGAVKNAVDKELYDTPVSFARGTAPIDGENAEINWLFQREHSSAPTIGENGWADYRSMDIYTPVTAGQKIAEKKPATAGMPGRTVRGREIRQIKGKDLRLPGGKNISYDDSRLAVYSKINGRVDYINGMLVISDCYTIKGDADMSVGNVDFDGDVVITGNVISDIEVKASHNIDVRGSAGGARLSAGGNVVLRGGMQGNDRGVIEAAGDIRAKYLERCSVKAGRDIAVDSMLHCQAESGNRVEAAGRHGSIIGGSVRARSGVTAKSLGSDANTKTEVSVGMEPAKRARMKFLRSDLIRLRAELEKLEKVCRYLSQTEDMSGDRQNLRKTAVLGKIGHEKLIREYENELKTIEEMSRESSAGDVNVSDTVYPGVRIIISLGELNVTNPIRFTTFRCSDREISLSPYRE